MAKPISLAEKYPAITSQAQYEKYKDIRSSCHHSSMKTYNHLTVLIVNWDIQNDPDILKSKAQPINPIQKKLTKKHV